MIAIHKETGEVIQMAQEVRAADGRCFQWYQLLFCPEPIDDFSVVNNGIADTVEQYRKAGQLTAKDIAAACARASVVIPNAVPKRKRKNDTVQFEIISINKRCLISEFNWCINNLRLQKDKGIIYQVSEIYIITSSQQIVDKVNKHFGSKFGFEIWRKDHVFYIN